MNTEIVCTSNEISIKAPGTVAGIKHFILKIVKALTFDAGAIFESKDWPYLWPK
jgi:hypothetical protein